jgi:hypothetical protein
LRDELDDGLDVLDLGHVLTHLTQRHDGCVLVAPILMLEHHLHDPRQSGQHHLLPNGTNKSISTISPKPHYFLISIFFDVLIKALHWTLPGLVDLGLDIHHMEKYHFDQLAQHLRVVLEHFRQLLREAHQQLSGLSFYALVIDSLIEYYLIAQLEH